MKKFLNRMLTGILILLSVFLIILATLLFILRTQHIIHVEWNEFNVNNIEAEAIIQYNVEIEIINSKTNESSSILVTADGTQTSCSISVTSFDDIEITNVQIVPVYSVNNRPTIYLSNDLPEIEAKWDIHMLKIYTLS